MENNVHRHPVDLSTAQRRYFITSTYHGLVRLNDSGLLYGSAYLSYAEAGIFEFVINNNLERLRHWMAEAAGYSLERMYRENNTFSADYLRNVFRVAICGDVEQLDRTNAAYRETPEAIPGERGTGGISPHNDDHWWHFADVLSLFFTGSERLADAMDTLIALPPRKQWTHSGDWWRAMVALAVEALTASKPDPWSHLAAVAAVNQRMFKTGYRDNLYEAWLAEMALSFIVAARKRGYAIPKKGPHASTPFGLFHLPSRPIVVRHYDYPHDIDDDLKRSITKAWRALKKKPRRRKKAR